MADYLSGTGHAYHIGSGTTPQKSDTQLMLLVKRLLALQTSLGGGAFATNDPSMADTKRMVLLKLARAAAGVEV